jgi:acyl carrier protein
MITPQQVYEGTLKAYKSVIDETPVCLETRLEELPLDSLDIMSAIMYFEENHNIRFHPEQEDRIFQMHSGNHTLQNLADYLFEIMPHIQTKPLQKLADREKPRTRQETYQRVVDVAKDVGKEQGTFSGDTTLEEIPYDSLDWVNFWTSLEDETKLRIHDRTISRFFKGKIPGRKKTGEVTLKDVGDYLWRRLEANSMSTAA